MTLANAIQYCDDFKLYLDMTSIKTINLIMPTNHLPKQSKPMCFSLPVILCYQLV